MTRKNYNDKDPYLVKKPRVKMTGLCVHYVRNA